MASEYQTLHAEWYDLVSDQIDHLPEVDFWIEKARQCGEPMLELGASTGRVLVPLLERGIDIVGIDTSGPMMERCRAKCAARNLCVELHEQSMVSLAHRRMTKEDCVVAPSPAGASN